MASISGSVTIAGDPDDWIACAFDADTHAFAGVAVVSAGAYEITGLTAGVAYVVACRPKTGGAWIAESAGFSVGDYCIPTDPAADPYIFKCTAASWAIDAMRYWRMRDMTVSSGDYLEVSEIQLHSTSGNENGNATLSASTNPDAPYTVSQIADGNLSSRAFWSSITGLSITWDFGGSPVSIVGVKFGGYDNSSRCPTGCVVESSSDNSNWDIIGTLSGLSYPGNNTLSSLHTLTAPGLTGASEPSWPTTAGNTIVDADITWTNMGQMVRPLMHGPLIAA